MNVLQLALNLIYRNPKSSLIKYRRFGGYLNYLQMMRNSRLMQEVSLGLPAVSSHIDGLPVYFLTGKNFFYQTLFCAYSLTAVSKERFCFTLVDDGSIDQELIIRINKQLPGAIVVLKQEIENNLRKLVAIDRLPHLNYRRKVYPHIKKLTDIHSLPGNDWKLVLDSDMLFWKEPLEILDWLRRPERPIHMYDCVESYGYSTALMEKLAGGAIPVNLNVGVIGLKSSSIKWPAIEKWIQALEEEEGTSYFLEQALTAMLIGNGMTTILAANDYIVNPGEDMIVKRDGILHHYVDTSKKGYFELGSKFKVPERD